MSVTEDPRSDAPVAVIGSGPDGIAAMIDVIVSIAYETPDGAPPVRLLVWDLCLNKKQGGDAYPLRGSPDEVHPFSTDSPPKGFPTFGAYIAELSREKPILRDALRAPAWGHILAYLQYSLELATMAFSAQVKVEVQDSIIMEIRETGPGAAATIVLSDGTAIEVRHVVRNRRPKHMASSAG